MPKTSQHQHLPFRFLFSASKFTLFILLLTLLLPTLTFATGSVTGKDYLCALWGYNILKRTDNFLFSYCSSRLIRV